MSAAHTPTPEQIDALVLELHTMGVKIPARDTAFFHAAVRKWLASWNDRDALVAALESIARMRRPRNQYRGREIVTLDDAVQIAAAALKAAKGEA